MSDQVITGGVGIFLVLIGVPPKSPQFSEKVRSAVPTLRSSRTRVGNPDRLTKLFGIGLRRRFDKLGRLIEA